MASPDYHSNAEELESNNGDAESEIHQNSGESVDAPGSNDEGEDGNGKDEGSEEEDHDEEEGDGDSDANDVDEQNSEAEEDPSTVVADNDGAPAPAQGTNKGLHGNSMENDDDGDANSKTKAAQTSKVRKEPQSKLLNQQKQQRPDRRRRPWKCPTRDTILIEVPLHVTADLGVAMRRTRKKRIRRIKRWAARLMEDETLKGTDRNQCEGGESQRLNGKKLQKNENDVADEKGNKGSGGDDGQSGTGFGDMEDEEDGMGGGIPRRDEFGSVLDYLEAKYVRGVMIADYDEREAKKQVKNKEKGKNDKDQEEDNAKGDEDSDDDGKGSCYEDSDGDFIDDSLLHEEVKDQVLASSAFGKTKIEEEALQRKKRKRDRMTESGDPKPKVDGDQSDDGGESDDHSDGEALSDFDDGFFVNVGDLEMADGWHGDDDVVIAPSQKKARKRARALSKNKILKPKHKVKKKKEKSLTSSGPKKKILHQSKAGKMVVVKSGPKKRKLKISTEGRVANVTSIVKSKTPDGDPMVSNKKLLMKKKKIIAKGSLIGEKKPKKVTPLKVAASEVSDKKSEHKEKSPPPVKESRPKTPREKATQLNRAVKRHFNVCVKMIKNLTPAELPRKKNKSTVKVSVKIPSDKSVGDEITFTNPNVPGQKLKVRIPEKADMENRSFVVSVPAGKAKPTTPESKENNFPKELKEALFDYSNAYDDWCTAEAEYYDSLPLSKVQTKFKPTTQRLKKFDEMVKEFPTNLATPVDISYLRLIVRRVRSNKAKIQARKESVPAEIKSLSTLLIRIPQKGTYFSPISFNKEIFQN